jgi:hypothetical protein
MASKTKYRVGAVQMSCSPNPDANLDKAADRVREAAPTSSAFQSSSERSIFASVKMPSSSIWRSPFLALPRSGSLPSRERKK